MLKNTILIVVFFLLVVLFVRTEEGAKTELLQESTAVYFSEADDGEEPTQALKITQKDLQSPFVIEFHDFKSVWRNLRKNTKPVSVRFNKRMPSSKSFGPYWSGQLNDLSFQVNNKNCEFGQVSTRLFNCNYSEGKRKKNLSEIAVHGKKVILHGLKSHLVVETSVDEDGAIIENKFYAVDLAMTIGKSYYNFRLMTPEELIETEGINSMVPIAKSKSLGIIEF